MINKFLFRQLFYLHKDIMLLTDKANGRIINANHAAQEFYGYSEEKLKARLVKDFEYQRNGLTIHKLANGEEHEVDIYTIPLATEKIEATLIIVHDISKNISIERKLNITEERLQYALENAGDGVWDWNLEDNTVFFSKKWKEMLGYKDNEIGNTLNEWSKRVHPDEIDEIKKLIQQHLEGKTPFYKSEHRVQCKDGNYKWILDRGKVTSYNDGKPVRMIGTHTDLTDFKNIENELNESNKRKDILLSIISHDLTGPLGSFKNLLNFIDENFERFNSEEIFKIIHEMKKTSASIYDLLDNLLNWARLNRNKNSGAVDKLLVGELIKTAITNLDYLNEEKNIIINTSLDENLSIHADRESMIIIFRNIISNALKFSYPGGIINISAEKKGGKIEINFTDRGTGISSVILEKLNSNYPRISSFGTNQEKGSGLGLGLCKEMLTINNGSIKIESTEGKGTNIKITLSP